MCACSFGGAHTTGGLPVAIPGAHPSQRALSAARFRAADLAAVAYQVNVQLLGVVGVDDRQHLVVGALEGCLRWKQLEPAANPVDVDVDRDLRDVPGEDEDAGRGFAADARQREQELERLFAARSLGPVEIRRLSELFEDLLDPRRLLLCEAAGTDRLLELVQRCIADLLP